VNISICRLTTCSTRSRSIEPSRMQYRSMEDEQPPSPHRLISTYTRSTSDAFDDTPSHSTFQSSKIEKSAMRWQTENVESVEARSVLRPKFEVVRGGGRAQSQRPVNKRITGSTHVSRVVRFLRQAISTLMGFTLLN
jgi:hypothetical protein